jgi:predicted NAD/FAD-dependent oxidoreductase
VPRHIWQNGERVKSLRVQDTRFVEVACEEGEVEPVENRGRSPTDEDVRAREDHQEWTATLSVRLDVKMGVNALEVVRVRAVEPVHEQPRRPSLGLRKNLQRRLRLTAATNLVGWPERP